MDIEKTALPGVIILKPEKYKDTRGFFAETYHRKKYQELGILCDFVQDNLSYSVQGVLRGLHYQLHHQQAKLVQCLRGRIFDAAVDIRVGSATFGKWAGAEISDQNGYQVFIPEGYAHGFCVLSEEAIFTYKCSDFYNPDDEGGVNWADPLIAIDWPLTSPIISEKDGHYPFLNQIPETNLPGYRRKSDE
jgi:dTDP-4-dehydrorhamnose 3,5-epimerase